MKEYRTIRDVAGPLIFVEKTEPVAYGELVLITLPDGTTRRGQVLDRGLCWDDGQISELVSLTVAK